MKIRVEIGELLLYGIDKTSAMNIGKAIERDLAILIKNDGIPKKLQMQNKFIPSLDGNTPSLKDRSFTDTNLIGRSIANSIYSSFGAKK